MSEIKFPIPTSVFSGKQARLLRAYDEYRKAAELYIRFLIEAHYSEALEGDNLEDMLDKSRRAFQSKRQELESALDKG